MTIEDIWVDEGVNPLIGETLGDKEKGWRTRALKARKKAEREQEGRTAAYWFAPVVAPFVLAPMYYFLYGGGAATTATVALTMPGPVWVIALFTIPAAVVGAVLIDDYYRNQRMKWDPMMHVVDAEPITFEWMVENQWRAFRGGKRYKQRVWTIEEFIARLDERNAKKKPYWRLGSPAGYTPDNLPGMPGFKQPRGFRRLRGPGTPDLSGDNTRWKTIFIKKNQPGDQFRKVPR